MSEDIERSMDQMSEDTKRPKTDHNRSMENYNHECQQFNDKQTNDDKQMSDKIKMEKVVSRVLYREEWGPGD
jgi:hypothetical protein